MPEDNLFERIGAQHKSPLARLEALARQRGWRNLSLLSTAGNDYDHYYFGDTSKFGQEMRKARGR